MQMTLILVFTFGCSNTNNHITNVNDKSINSLDSFTYVPKYISLSDSIGVINNFTHIDENIYFSTYTHTISRNENALTWNYSADIYVLNVEEFEPTKLENYSPYYAIPANVLGGFSIDGISTDDIGNLWVLESWKYYGYDFPEDYDIYSHNDWQYETVYSSGSILRKLDITGTELLNVDLLNLTKQADTIINLFCIDGYGNLYLGADIKNTNNNTTEKMVFVFDNNGTFMFEIDIDYRFERLIKMLDGSIAFCIEEIRGNVEPIYILQKIDFVSQALGDAINIPSFYSDRVSCEIYSGGISDILIINSESMYTYTSGEQIVELFNWIDTDIVNENNITNITAISDNKIVCTIIDRETSEREFLILTKTLRSEIPEKTVLTLATIGRDSILNNLVAKYNRANPDYRIQIVDYADFNTNGDSDAGLMRLNTDIVTGNIPDIMYVSSMPYNEYVAKELFIDLYELIENDTLYKRTDFVENVFRAAETNGYLYQVFPAFFVEGILGNSSVVGNASEWCFDDFNAVLDMYPEADIPFGSTVTKSLFLEVLFINNMGEYIDWNTGTVKFDTLEFVNLLEIINKALPDEINESNATGVYDAFSTGRQLMIIGEIPLFGSSFYKNVIGEDLVYKSFPSKDKSKFKVTPYFGLSITKSCEHKDAAWLFVRTVLNKSYQLGIQRGYPTNQAAYNTRIEEALNPSYDNILEEGIFDDTFMPCTQTDIEYGNNVLNSLDGVSVFYWNKDAYNSIIDIINEEASDFFSGIITASTAADRIQSRVSIMVSERS